MCEAIFFIAVTLRVRCRAIVECVTSTCYMKDKTSFRDMVVEYRAIFDFCLSSSPEYALIWTILCIVYDVIPLPVEFCSLSMILDVVNSNSSLPNVTASLSDATPFMNEEKLALA